MMAILSSMDLWLRLKEALDLPDHCFEVTVRLTVDAAVTIEAKYWAPDKAIDPKTGLVDILTKNYYLVEIEPSEVDPGLSSGEIITKFDQLIRDQDA